MKPFSSRALRPCNLMASVLLLFLVLGLRPSLADPCDTPEAHGAQGGLHNDTTAVQAALTAIQSAGKGCLYLSQFYRVSAALSITNTPISITGSGYGTAGFIDIGVSSGQFVLNLNQTDYRDAIYLANFSIRTNQSAVSNGIYVAFGATDSTYNRAPQRFVMENIDIRGQTLASNGLLSNGFVVGIRVVNTIRPIFRNITISGMQTGFSESQNNSMSVGFDLISSSASPTDPVFRDTEVISAAVGYKGTGHWEGWIFDHALCVFCTKAIDLNADTMGPAYPWVQIVNSHFNTFRDAVSISNYFDVTIANNLFYKFYMASILKGTFTINQNTITGISSTTGLMPGQLIVSDKFPSGTLIATVTGPYSVTTTQNATGDGVNVDISFGLAGAVDSKAIVLSGPTRWSVTGNTFENLTFVGVDSAVFRQFDGIYATDATGVGTTQITNLGSVSGNIFSGVTYPVTLDGTVSNVTYRGEALSHIPIFGPTPVEYRSIGTGTGNKRLNVPFQGTNSNAATVNLTSTPQIVAALATDNLEAGDRLLVTMYVGLTKDAAAGPVTVSLTYNGTSNANFIGWPYGSAPSVTQYCAASSTCNVPATFEMEVAARGSLGVNLSASVTGTATVAANKAILAIMRNTP